MDSQSVQSIPWHILLGEDISISQAFDSNEQVFDGTIK